MQSEAQQQTGNGRHSQQQNQIEEQFRKEVTDYLSRTYNWNSPKSDVLANAIIRNSNEFNRGMLWDKLKLSLETIRQSAGESAGYAFQALSNDKIADLFTRNPELVADAFPIADYHSHSNTPQNIYF